MADWIQSGDAEFDGQLAQFVTYMNANLANLGIGALDPEVIAVNTAKTDWDVAYPEHLAARAAAQGAYETKEAARAAAIAALRTLGAQLQVSPDVDNAERAALTLTVRDLIPTPVAAPTSRPVVVLDTSQRLRIGGRLFDEETPTSRAKPSGVLSAEIYFKLDDPPPGDLDDCEFAATVTRPSFLIEFDGEDAGKAVHVIARWMSTRGEFGPLSETVSATVVA